MIDDGGTTAHSGSVRTLASLLPCAQIIARSSGRGRERDSAEQTGCALLEMSPPPSSSSPSPPLPLRNQAGPALRRTEPHSASLIDKTPWKKSTANHRPDCDAALWAGLYGRVTGNRLRGRSSFKKKKNGWCEKEIGTRPWNNSNFPSLPWQVLGSCLEEWLLSTQLINSRS